MISKFAYKWGITEWWLTTLSLVSHSYCHNLRHRRVRQALPSIIYCFCARFDVLTAVPMKIPDFRYMTTYKLVQNYWYTNLEGVISQKILQLRWDSTYVLWVPIETILIAWLWLCQLLGCTGHAGVLILALRFLTSCYSCDWTARRKGTNLTNWPADKQDTVDAAFVTVLGRSRWEARHVTGETVMSHRTHTQK